MYKKGDKFVIEIGGALTGADSRILYRIKGFNSLVFDCYGLEKLGKLVDGVDSYSKSIGYAEGYKEGFKDGVERERERVKGLIESLTNPEKKTVHIRESSPLNGRFWGEEVIRELKRGVK